MTDKIPEKIQPTAPTSENPAPPTPQQEVEAFHEKRLLPTQKDYYKKIDEMLGKNTGFDVKDNPLYAEAGFKLKQFVVDRMNRLREKIEQGGPSEQARAQWMDLLNEATKDLDEYAELIAAELFRLGHDSDGLDAKDLYELIVSAKGILTIMEKQYDEIFKKIATNEALTPEEIEKIALNMEAMPPDTIKSPLKTLSAIGPLMLFGRMKPAERLEVAKAFIKNRPLEAKNFVEAMTAGNLLSVEQAKTLWNPEWGPLNQEQMAAAQQEAEKQISELETKISAGGDENPMVKVFRPKNLLGIFMQAWGTVNGTLNLALSAFKYKNLPALATNPWFLASVGAVVAGRELTSNENPTAMISSLVESGEEKEKLQQEQAKKEAQKLIMRHVDFYENYLAKGDYEGAKTVTALTTEKREGEKVLQITLPELIAAEKNPERKKYLENLAAQEGKKFDIENLLSWMAGALKTIAIPEDVKFFYQEARKSEGLA